MLMCTAHSLRAIVFLFVLLSVPAVLAQNSFQPVLRQTARKSSPKSQGVIRQIKIHGTKDSVEIEVDTSDRITPQSQLLTGPDRLVLDFPNAIPGTDLRSQSIYVGAVKDVRAGLFRSSPPVTRLVIDLDNPETYQIFPAGRSVMIKMSTTSSPRAAAVDPWREPAVPPAVAAISPAIQVIAPAIPPSEPPKPSLEVRFVNGLLSIKADRVTLAEILQGVQQRTGAQISIAPGADQEKVVADIGPAPAQEVLAHLLNGSKFNFLILNAAGDPKKLDRVILTPRMGGGSAPLTPLQTADAPQPEPAMSPAPGQPDQAQIQLDPGAVNRPELQMPPDPDAPQ